MVMWWLSNLHSMRVQDPRPLQVFRRSQLSGSREAPTVMVSNRTLKNGTLPPLRFKSQGELDMGEVSRGAFSSQPPSRIKYQRQSNPRKVQRNLQGVSIVESSRETLPIPTTLTDASTRLGRLHQSLVVTTEKTVGAWISCLQ